MTWRVTANGVLFSSALMMGLVAFAPEAMAQAPAKSTSATSQDPKAAQREKDFEHELLQSDGVNHPREIVKDKGVQPKAAPKRTTKKTQRDLDLEHDMVQTDGVNHPRETLKNGKAQPKAPMKATRPGKKTQRDLDLEHDMVQSDGVNHPREVLKK